jgi:radical SAM superfamily enzyme YgiQ (UPF0313 family)
MGSVPPGDQIPILTHRGCPFRCNFCSHNSGFNARFRSPGNVLEEIAELLDRYAPEVIRFEDETFGVDLRRTKAMLQGILQRGHQNRVRFSAQTRVDRIDEQFVDLLTLAFEMLQGVLRETTRRVMSRALRHTAPAGDRATGRA